MAVATKRLSALSCQLTSSTAAEETNWGGDCECCHAPCYYTAATAAAATAAADMAACTRSYHHLVWLMVLECL